LPPDTASSIPAQVAAASPFRDLAYRFTVDHWPRLAELAGDHLFWGARWLLPNAARNDNDSGRIPQLLADQRRLAGATGATAAERIAYAISLYGAVRQRDAQSLYRALADWQPAR
jgi:hypothetical protein